MAQAAEKQFNQRIAIDMGTRLMLDVDGVDSRVKSQLIGLLHHEFLIVRAPVGVTGVRDKLVEGRSLTVRYLYGGHVFGFETEIHSMIAKPKPLLLLHYPMKVASVTLRKSQRIDCFIHCSLQIEGEAYPGTIMDFSNLGCRCLVPGLPDNTVRAINQEGLEARLQFAAPNDKRELDFPVHIVNETEYKSSSKLGISFDELDDEEHRQVVRIYEFLESQ